ncbi:uncharacterized protein LOC115355056 [Myripristis murdjan]|uniref:Uncharacterized LOC115355056 n=1 Tax=Myripristis murdjan TaxID=586833 RepID=A0A667YTC9_9TELE|nr:uncharacterized protein LOC115355056 [Myripristis murdjan]
MSAAIPYSHTEYNHWQGTPGQSATVSWKRYEWQLSDGHRYLRIDNDHVIEAHYCQPGAKGITINTASHGKVSIDFDRLQTQSAAVRVHRLTFLPQGQAEDIGWYFRDDKIWREYGSQGTSSSVSSVSSTDIEHQFTLNPQGAFSFTVGSISYILDFSTMTQTNHHTGVHRNVRRRPKFISTASHTGSLLSASVLPTASSSQLPATSYKWEFMGEEGMWSEYQAHICAYDSAAIERQYQQNPQGQLHFRINRFSYTLNFSTMQQVNNSIGTPRAVRRTAVDGSQQNSSLLSASVLPTASSSQLPATSYKWEFMGEEGMWSEYQAHICAYDSAAIERQYQQNPQGQLHFRINRFSYTLNFSTMQQVNNSIGTPRAVRRTAVDGSQQNSSVGAQPQWQFLDVSGIWNNYFKGHDGCSISSQDIEIQYQQNPLGTMTFTTVNFNYELDFSAMTQRNLSTNTTRSVRRI